jgi:phosphoribosylformylglycinamidine cyclo-ligase
LTAEAYKAAGVDIQAADALKENISAFAAITHNANVLKGVGFFSGMYRLRGYKEPVLVSTTDGVGTKLKIAVRLGHYESLGIDLVNLNVNDLVPAGATPLFLLDYISLGKLDAQVVEPLLRGMAWACREIGCALIGGETAQSPGLYTGDDFDLAGTMVGVVEESAMVDMSRIAEGDVLLGLPSSGLHTNGYTLVRKVFGIDANPAVLHRKHDELGHTLGEELLIPHRCYYQSLAPHYSKVKGMAHISGGGLIGNVPRVLPSGLAAVINTSAWEPQPIFKMIQNQGPISSDEMYQVFNMGIGMVLVCDPQRVTSLQKALPEARVIGRVVKQESRERVVLRTGR